MPLGSDIIHVTSAYYIGSEPSNSLRRTVHIDRMHCKITHEITACVILQSKQGLIKWDMLVLHLGLIYPEGVVLIKEEKMHLHQSRTEK